MILTQWRTEDVTLTEHGMFKCTYALLPYNGPFPLSDGNSGITTMGIIVFQCK